MRDKGRDDYEAIVDALDHLLELMDASPDIDERPRGVAIEVTMERKTR